MGVETDLNFSSVLGTSEDDVLIGTGRSDVLWGAAGDESIQA